MYVKHAAAKHPEAPCAYSKQAARLHVRPRLCLLNDHVSCVLLENHVLAQEVVKIREGIEKIINAMSLQLDTIIGLIFFFIRETLTLSNNAGERAGVLHCDSVITDWIC